MDALINLRLVPVNLYRCESGSIRARRRVDLLFSFDGFRFGAY